MQRLYNDDDSTDVLGRDGPIAQQDIRSDYCSFHPLFREDAADSAVFICSFECGIRHPHP